MKNGFKNLFAAKYRRALFVLPLCFLFSMLGPVNPAIAAESSGPFVILIGPPASGKTSNGNYISEKYGVPSIDVLKVLQDEMAKAAQNKMPTGKPGSRRSNAWSERNRSINKAMKKLDYYEGDSLHMVDATKEKAEVRVQIDGILGR